MLSNVSMGFILITIALMCTSYFTPTSVFRHLKKNYPLSLYFSLYITYFLFSCFHDLSPLTQDMPCSL